MHTTPMRRRALGGTVSGGVKKLTRNQVMGDRAARSKRYNSRELTFYSPPKCTCPGNWNPKGTTYQC
jgi:hypothetical protein